MKTLLRALLVVAAFATTALVRANSTYHVWLDTSSLVGNPANPFSLDFQLNDGAGFGDSSNSVTIGNFKFGGGSASGSPSLFGGAAGSLSSGVTLTDSSAFNEFYERFTPGSWLSFSINLSTNFLLGGTPDFFSFAILDGNLMNLPTNSWGSDNFLEINLDSSSPVAATFSSADGKISTKVPDALNGGLCAAGALAALIALQRRRACA